MLGMEKYGVVLNAFLANDFEFRMFNSLGAKAKVVHLRHDIDFSIEHAFAIAKFEHELNVRSTYFFMLTSNTYNLLSAHNQNLVRSIKEFGHKISLHFDPTVYEDIDVGFATEQKLMQDTFGVEVDICSIHRPGIFLENSNRRLPNCSHTYEDKFFKEMLYISDSGGSYTRKLVTA